MPPNSKLHNSVFLNSGISDAMFQNSGNSKFLRFIILVSLEVLSYKVYYTCL